MASRLHRQGAVDSTGSTISVRKELAGFRPKAVQLYVTDDPSNPSAARAVFYWTAGMPDGGGMKVVQSSTGSSPQNANIDFVSSGGVTPKYDGFEIGTDSDINNTSGWSIFYQVWG